MKLKSMNISLKPSMKAWVKSLVKSGKYVSASEYVRELIRKDMTKR